MLRKGVSDQLGFHHVPIPSPDCNRGEKVNFLYEGQGTVIGQPNQHVTCAQEATECRDLKLKQPMVQQSSGIQPATCKILVLGGRLGSKTVPDLYSGG